MFTFFLCYNLINIFRKSLSPQWLFLFYLNSSKLISSASASFTILVQDKFFILPLFKSLKWLLLIPVSFVLFLNWQIFLVKEFINKILLPLTSNFWGYICCSVTVRVIDGCFFEFKQSKLHTFLRWLIPRLTTTTD